MNWKKVDDIPHNINISGFSANTLQLFLLDQCVREAGECLGRIFQLFLVYKCVFDLEGNTN